MYFFAGMKLNRNLQCINVNSQSGIYLVDMALNDQLNPWNFPPTYFPLSSQDQPTKSDKEKVLQRGEKKVTCLWRATLFHLTTAGACICPVHTG